MHWSCACTQCQLLAGSMCLWATCAGTHCKQPWAQNGLPLHGVMDQGGHAQDGPATGGIKARSAVQQSRRTVLHTLGTPQPYGVMDQGGHAQDGPATEEETQQASPGATEQACVAAAGEPSGIPRVHAPLAAGPSALKQQPRMALDGPLIGNAVPTTALCQKVHYNTEQ